MQGTQKPTDEPARDILAAEAFAVPAPDPSLRRDPVVLPEDPSGIAGPHDVLAAEEFAMPATRRPSSWSPGSRGTQARALGAAAAGGALVLLVALGIRRRLGSGFGRG